jgi:hypothetical protein
LSDDVQNLDGFPYHPLVYHLDLSILAYQIYGQSLVWPFDPYYEEMSNTGGRTQLMSKVRTWATIKGSEQVKLDKGLSAYRGPGILSGFEDNPRHDPIIYRYDRICPWSSNLNKPLDSWLEYKVPKEITSRIKGVFVCYRKAGKPVDSVAIEKLATHQAKQDMNAKDVLFAFEGGTGDKGIDGQPASQSIMGFVLMRYYPNNKDYDVHIVFRGSRSGSGGRAALQAFSDDDAKGNPDWITDLGYDLLDSSSGGAFVTTTGSVSRGMTTCIKSISPCLFECLNQVVTITDKTKPKRIFVTGHSLGGGLAQMFTSLIIMGDQYGPGGTGKAMPAELHSWPWKQLKLITFSAPRVGDEVWAKKLTIDGLSVDFFSTIINPYDIDALKPTDQTILPLLTDVTRPSGFRVLIPSDPITTEKVPGGKHVGKTVYVSKPELFAPITQNVKAHEPANVRKQLSSGLKDSRIPSTPWLVWKMTDLNADRDDSKKGSLKEYLKLESSLERYYRDNDMHFDSLGFKLEFDLFMDIYNAN